MVPATVLGFWVDGRARRNWDLFGYLLALTIAVLSPAVWAARGTQGLERVWCSWRAALRPFRRG